MSDSISAGKELTETGNYTFDYNDGLGGSTAINFQSDSTRIRIPHEIV